MAQLDANFNSSIFRKDWPIIIAMRRDLASFIGVRVPFDANGYLPGQVLAYNSSTQLFNKWSAVSGSLTPSCILYDGCDLQSQQQVAQPPGSTSGVSGSSLLRALAGGFVYTNMLVDYNSTAKSGLGATDLTDSGGNLITKF
jgi:hypothetical protein